jgi:hypothetical protein
VIFKCKDSPASLTKKFDVDILSGYHSARNRILNPAIAELTQAIEREVENYPAAQRSKHTLEWAC